MCLIHCSSDAHIPCRSERKKKSTLSTLNRIKKSRLISTITERSKPRKTNSQLRSERTDDERDEEHFQLEKSEKAQGVSRFHSKRWRRAVEVYLLCFRRTSTQSSSIKTLSRRRTCRRRWLKVGTECQLHQVHLKMLFQRYTKLRRQKSIKWKRSALFTIPNSSFIFFACKPWGAMHVGKAFFVHLNSK